MRKLKEILEKLERIEYLLEKPAKYKIGDNVFYSVGDWIDYYAEIPEALIEVEILNVRLLNYEFAKTNYFRWEYYILTEYFLNKYEWVYCRLFSKEEIRKFEKTIIILPPEKIKVSEYLERDS